MKYFLLLLVCFIVFSSCTEKKERLVMSNFHGIPSEVDGCSCYFSETESDQKNENYLFVSDFAQTAFIKINDSLLKFRLTKTIDEKDGNPKVIVYRNGDRTITVTIKKNIDIGDELSHIEGSIELINDKKTITTKQFVGECGC